MTRPAVTVILPFSGDASDAERMIRAMRAITLSPADELLLIDNSSPPRLSADDVPSGWRVVIAGDERSAYYARNIGAALARREWLLFTDADCAPDAAILDAYLEQEPGSRCGAIAGGIKPALEQTAFLARWAQWRAILDQRHGTGHPFRPFASTANLLVRRAAFEEAGGFCEGIRSAGDADLCWRLQELGWELEERPAALIRHRHRERLGDLVHQAMRYGRGRAWLGRRFPQCPPSTGVARQILRALAAVPFHALRGNLERAGFRAVDASFALAMALARPLTNRPGAPVVQRARATVVMGRYPGPDIPAAVPDGLRIEAGHRPLAVRDRDIRHHDVTYCEDDCVADRIRACAALLARHPFRVLRALGRGRLAHAAPAARAMRAGGDLRAGGDNAIAAAQEISALTGLPLRVDP